MTTKRRKPKRPARTRTPVVDYVLVIEDDAGQPLALTVQKDTRAPIAGEEVPLQERAVKEMPHLAGRYIVKRVAHLPPPNAPVTINRYTIPWCYARRVGGGSLISAPPSQRSTTHASGKLDPLPGDDLDESTVAELSQRSRQIATDLGDMAEELAAAVHSGMAGTVGLDMVQRLDDASRRMKQVALSTLFRARIRRESQ